MTSLWSLRPGGSTTPNGRTQNGDSSTQVRQVGTGKGAGVLLAITSRIGDKDVRHASGEKADMELA